ncbi:MAG: 50S ribosomal protein L13 [Chitinophagales bacterium]|nr:MAG: 50S ribosomal protein L13 [Chitinophagales bacterium]
MNTLSYKTLSANEQSVQRAWYIVDAENKTLGRLTSKIASILRGKNKPYFTPHVDCGDYVIVVNADKVRLTGKKWTDKQYVRHTGYPGGQRFETPKTLAAKRPEAIIEYAVYGMLPKNSLGRKMMKKLFVYAGTDHPHHAQNPKPLTL